MYQDDDDLDFVDTQLGPAGTPDPESAASLSLWLHGLLDEPLDHLDSPKQKKPSTEFTARKPESFDEF